LVRWTRRTASAVLAVTTVLALTAPAATAAPTTTEAATASSWLAAALDGDTDMIVGDWGVDHGLTADVILSLTATGNEAEAQARAYEALVADMDTYLTFGDPDELYAGPLAKLSMVVLSQGDDPTAVPSGDEETRDLIAELRDLEEGGRFSDRSQWGDHSNVISQSLALLAFVRAGEELPDGAVDVLVEARCGDGGFPTYFGSATCTSSPDATGFAVQAIAATLGADAGCVGAEAMAWLERTQESNGGWVSGDSGETLANANSTGLATQALLVTGADTTAPRAFLTGLQNDDGGLGYSEGDASDVRATAQAVAPMAELPLQAIGGSPVEPVSFACTPEPEPEAETEPTNDTEPAGGEDNDGGTDATLLAADGDEPREGTEAAPGEMPRTGTGTALALGLLGAALVAAGLVALRRTPSAT
jgi:hypothetical protein